MLRAWLHAEILVEPNASFKFKFQKFSFSRNFTSLFPESTLALYFCNPRNRCSGEKNHEFLLVRQVSLDLGQTTNFS